MAINEFSFTPEQGFLDAQAYPDPSTEAQVRQQLMSLHTQEKEYLNTEVKTAITAIAAEQDDTVAIAAIMAALADLDDLVGTLPADVSALQTRVTALEGRPVYTTATMAVADWVGTTYSFEDDYSSSEYDIEIALDADNVADESEVDAWSSAKIVGSATTNMVTAYGTVPSVPLHILIKVVQKI